MSRKSHFQKTKELQTSKDSSHTEQSSYWDDVATNGREHVQANPDSLPETEIAIPSTPQLIMGEAIDHLQGRQRECYILVMREEKSMADAAEILGITKSSVQVYVNRATKFITAYCKAAIQRGRV